MTVADIGQKLGTLGRRVPGQTYETLDRNWTDISQTYGTLDRNLTDIWQTLHWADISRVSNIESDNSQNVGLEDYNNISDRIFPYFTTPSIKITLG